MKIIISKSKKYGDQEVFVDDEDYDYLNQFTWSIGRGNKTLYVERRKTTKGVNFRIRMHIELMNTPKGFIIDHKDRNGLNNQKSNLRICTKSQNMMNTTSVFGSTSKYKGVSKKNYNSIRKLATGEVKTYKYTLWVAVMMINKKHKTLGRFPFTPEGELAAARCYDYYAVIYHKEFANLNLKEEMSVQQ